MSSVAGSNTVVSAAEIEARYVLRLAPGEDGMAAARLSLLLPGGPRMSTERAAELNALIQQANATRAKE